MRILTLILLLVSINSVAKTPLDISLIFGGSLYDITTEQIFYDPAPLGSLWNFMGIDENGGNTFFIGGNVTHNIHKILAVNTGLEFSCRQGRYQERIEGSAEKRFNFFYTGLPVEAILFPQSRLSIVAGIEPNLLIASGGFNKRLYSWAESIYYSYGVEQDLRLNRLNVNVEAGIALKVWKIIITTSYYHSLLPFLGLYSPKPTAATYEGNFRGLLNFYYSGFEIKLNVPIKVL